MKINKILKRHKLIIIIFVVVFVYFSYNYFKQEIKLQELSQENHEKKIEIQKIDNKIERFEKDLKNVKSNENISKIAREKLKMVYPNEILYIIEDK
jgi:cell division protein FtsB